MTIEIIAELAQGFEGNPAQAKLLMKAAASAGANAAKYQMIFADELATPDYKYYALFKSLEMSDDVWHGLANYAKELNIQLQLDIFGTKSLSLAGQIGAYAIKLHGTDIANVGLLNEVAKSRIGKVLLGAGGAYLEELEQALSILSNKEVVILLGFQGYPTANQDNQIGRIRLLIQHFSNKYPNVSIGFADHASPESALRYALASVAIGAGAKVIEKHLTLGKVMQLEDHESALNPDEFLEFTNTIQDCAHALGISVLTEDFGMTDSEQEYRKMIRRHVVASSDIASGTRLLPSHLTLKRTSSEAIFTDLSLVYHKKLKREVKMNTALSLEDI
jgi:N,N'-diacetyllegionaminate synthase